MSTLSRKRSRPFRYLADRLLRRFVVPTPRLVLLAAAGSVIVPVGYALNAGAALFWGYNALLLLFSAADLLLLPKRREIEAVRLLPDRADVGTPFDVSITVTNHGKLPVEVQIADDWPLPFEGTSSLLNGVRLTGRGGSASIAGSVTGTERGKYVLSWLDVRYWGGLGLWMKQVRIAAPEEIKIVPDLSGVRGILGSLQDRLILDGKRIFKRHTVGSEFSYIREYTTDDDPRTINWVATARQQRLMTNVRQPERGKIVMLLLDCGRMMGTLLDSRVKLDRTMEAALCLAAVALKHGDQVGVLAFAGDVRAYVPPNKGMAHLQTILETVYDLKSGSEESGYERALLHLMRMQKKRSLVVLFSDMDNYLLEDRLLPYLARLRRVHVPILVSLQDPLLQEWTRADVTDLQRAFIRSTAQKFAENRREYATKMAGLGIQVLDVPADRLALTAVNAYLDVKSREAL